MGYAIYLAQTGSKHSSANPLKGFGSASVLEIIDDYDGDTYRAVYTVKFADFVYVLHCFQKKELLHLTGCGIDRKEVETSPGALQRVK